MNFFFYGTLMDDDVLATVIGRRVGLRQAGAAELDGYRRLRRAGATYPVIVPTAGGRVGGRLVRGLTAVEKRALDRFEGAGYGAVIVAVRTRIGSMVSALAYLPVSSQAATDEPWDFGLWRRRHRAAFLHRARRCGVPS